MRREDMKGSILAAALSGILPGAGQMYNHRWMKGIGFMLPVLIISGLLRRKVVMSGGSLMGLLPQNAETFIAQLALLAVAVWSVMDAYRTVQHKK
jgi:TM2 domain-containing membrane protein YozV